MIKRAMTYFFVLAGILFRSALSYALITDPVNNVLKEIQVQEKKIGSFQEDYVNQYTQLRSGKIGSLGDVSMVKKATKKIEQAQKAMERLQQERESLEKKIAKAQEFKDKNLGKLKEYSEQVSGIQDRINKEREKIRNISEQVETKKQQLEDIQGLVKGKAEQATEVDSEDLELIVGDADLAVDEDEEMLQEETLMVRPAVMQNQVIKYSLPAMVAQEGELTSLTTVQPQMTMLPNADEEAVVVDRWQKLNVNAVNLNTALPKISEVTTLKQLPQRSAEEVKRELTMSATVQKVAPQERVMKSSLSVEDQLISSDNVQENIVENSGALEKFQDALPMARAKRAFVKEIETAKEKEDMPEAVLQYQGESAVVQEIEAKAVLSEKIDDKSANIKQPDEKDKNIDSKTFVKLPVQTDKKTEKLQIKAGRKSFKRNVVPTKRQIKAKGVTNE